MRAAFETESDDAAFRPEPVEPNDIRSWVTDGLAAARRALDSLGNRAKLASQDRALAKTLLARRNELAERLRTSLRNTLAFSKTRHHGDYHLGQSIAHRLGARRCYYRFRRRAAASIGSAARKTCRYAGCRRHAILCVRNGSGEKSTIGAPGPGRNRFE